MSSFRPGSEEAKRFFESSAVDSNQWLTTLERYDDAITLLGKVKGKPEMNDLDLFWRSQLAETVRARKPQRLTREELSTVMRWKLTRGKFRPLQKLCDSNSEKSVSEASEVALKHLSASNSDWKSAMKSLCTLRGIGEATASAVLAPFRPDLCPFMADEVLDVTCGRRDYTAKAYDTMRSSLIQKARELGSSWTPEDVGRTIWTKAILSAYDSSSSINSSSNDSSGGEKETTKKIPNDGAGSKKGSKGSKNVRGGDDTDADSSAAVGEIVVAKRKRIR